MINRKEQDRWSEKIEELFAEGKLKSHQCKVYSNNSKSTTIDQKCGFQRFIRHHSFDGPELTDKPTQEEWTVENRTKPISPLIYRCTESAKYLRCSCETQKDIETLYELMRSVCDQPKLIISVYGGRKYFTMSEAIEKEFMDSVAEAATTSAKLIGEGVARLRALVDKKRSVTLLGMAWWGNIAEQTRTMVLELQRRNSILDFDEAILSNVPFRSNDKDTHSLEQNHTHFLLLDDGKYRSEHKHEEDSSSKQQSEFMKTINYPKEMQRSDFVTHACDREKCYGVTLVIEGGINTCLAILNDIQCKRPVVFVEGSGKMADVIASLMKLTAINEYTPVRKPERHEIEHNLLRFPMRARTEKEQQQQIDQIGKIMDPNNHIFDYLIAHFAQSDQDVRNRGKVKATMTNQEAQKDHLLELAIEWDCFEQATNLLDELQYVNKPKLLAKLFKQALDGDRPPFIDFFLRINYDPRRTLDFLEKEKSLANIQNYECVESTTDVHSNINIGVSIQKIPISYQNQVKLSKRGVDLILRLYKDALLSNGQNLSSEYSIESAYPTSIDQLDILYSEWMGNFLPPLHSRRSSLDQIKLEIQRVLHTFRCNLCWCNTACYRQNLNTSGLDSYESTGFIVEKTALFRLNQDLEAKARVSVHAEESTQIILRDLLFWAVFTGHTDIAKVLILHIRSRICAALCCAAILKHRARKANASDKRHLYRQQADDLELYATDCINACYSKSERRGCELMTRQVPLFGNATCMQVAIAWSCSNFINANCFSQVLNRVWFNKLAQMNLSVLDVAKIIASLITCGLLAPWFISYRLAEDTDEIYYQKNDPDSKNSDLGNRVHSKSNTLSSPSKILSRCDRLDHLMTHNQVTELYKHLEIQREYFEGSIHI
ncbi:unnamed protein product [Rotaria magnacalcarata]|uniref:Uncharacterized protein n=1 Tax=Rotaria magnacalcarata TaxID=392030 RepID=A0A815M1R7_9BILA|nr:unnamed protein product [Rotaria magnacalcarata]